MGHAPLLKRHQLGFPCFFMPSKMSDASHFAIYASIVAMLLYLVFVLQRPKVHFAIAFAMVACMAQVLPWVDSPLPSALACWGISTAILFLLHLYSRSNLRSHTIKPAEERIAILGASTVDGIGAAIARECVRRGSSRIVLVARRMGALEKVKQSLIDEQESEVGRQCARNISLFTADCTSEEDVYALQQKLIGIFGGLDTLYIVFGRLWDCSFLSVAKADPIFGATGHTSLEGLRSIKQSVGAVMETNVNATALVLAALIPCMQMTSNMPFISAIGSVAAIVAAPTRTVYCASKAAQDMLLHGVCLECETQAKVPGRALVQYNVIAPNTVATSFRKHAWQDGQSSSPTVGKILAPDDVGVRAVQEVDQRTTGVVAMPRKYARVRVFQPFMYVSCLLTASSRLVDRAAHKYYAY